jgi:ATP-dependent helicase/nuclease subunit B
MLTTHIIQDPDIKLQVLDKFINESRQWVVNDLDTKFWLQSYLRNKKNIICSDHVLRASELWQKLLLDIDPSWQILPVELSPYLIEKWMSEILKKQNLNLSSKDFKKAYQTIGQILPLLSHEQGQEAIAEWFAQTQDAKERWYEWYQLGLFLWQKFKDNKIIPVDWMKAILINEFFDKIDHHPFVFDLGQDIDDVESELILNISRIIEVDLIIPESEIDNECYSHLISRSQTINYQNNQILAQRVYKKFPSQLAEVKDAVATVRSWLDQGLPASEIAIVSPIIENYWPTLCEYLMVEGIAFNKNIVSPLSQFEIFQTWMSKMRLAIDEMNNYDGEQIIFSSEEEPEIHYDQYLSLFENIYEVTDYKRSKIVQDKLPKPIKSSQKMQFSEFIKWAFSLMPENSWANLIERLPDFDKIYFIKEDLEIEKWVDFLAQYFSRNEFKINQGDSKGISVIGLSGALNRPLKKIYLMGLTEKSLKEKLDTALHWTDIESIKLQFGFNLPHADRTKTLDQLSWMERKSLEEIFFTLAETDFSGQFQAPSLYWLRGALDEKHSIELDMPKETRWDQLMANNPEMDWQLPESFFIKMNNMIDRDLGTVSGENTQISHLSLSASKFEEYFKCPFRFFAANALNLTNLPSLDLDIDAMTRGKLIHKICEILISKNQLTHNYVEIEELVEKARKSIDMPIYNNEIWTFLKPHYIQLTQQFINHEIKWRQDFPATKTYALEKSVDTKISLTEDGISFSKDGLIPFRGFIDRIDTNGENQFVIIDYKSTGSKLTQYGSWLKNGKIQLALYSLAIIEGALDGEAKDVVAAFYFVIKGLDRTKGFVINEADPDFLSSKKMDRHALEDLLSETKIKVGEMLADIIAGKMQPKPHDENICETCDWNKICRYPHLNH